MPVVTASGTNASTQLTASWARTFSRVNSGTVAGNIPAGVVKGLGINTIADDRGQPYGSRVVPLNGIEANTSDRVGVSGAINAAGTTLAFNQSPTQWIMLGGVTTRLNTLVNSGIYTTASDWSGRPNVTLTAISGTIMHGSGTLNSFDFYADPNGTINPNFTRAANAGSRASFVRPSGNGAVVTTPVDYFPTRAVPGELTYRAGGSVPVLADYRSKETFES
jgi:hypothetical protein